MQVIGSDMMNNAMYIYLGFIVLFCSQNIFCNGFALKNMNGNIENNTYMNAIGFLFSCKCACVNGVNKMFLGMDLYRLLHHIINSLDEELVWVSEGS